MQTYVYQAIATAVFVLISLVFIKPPAWVMRALKSFATWLDRRL